MYVQISILNGIYICLFPPSTLLFLHYYFSIFLWLIFSFLSAFNLLLYVQYFLSFRSKNNHIYEQDFLDIQYSRKLDAVITKKTS